MLFRRNCPNNDLCLLFKINNESIYSARTLFNLLKYILLYCSVDILKMFYSLLLQNVMLNYHIKFLQNF